MSLLLVPYNIMHVSIFRIYKNTFNFFQLDSNSRFFNRESSRKFGSVSNYKVIKPDLKQKELNQFFSNDALVYFIFSCTETRVWMEDFLCYP